MRARACACVRAHPKSHPPVMRLEASVRRTWRAERASSVRAARPHAGAVRPWVRVAPPCSAAQPLRLRRDERSGALLLREASVEGCREHVVGGAATPPSFRTHLSAPDDHRSC
eukprot:4949068-Prymnesium_polylepis.1